MTAIPLIVTRGGLARLTAAQLDGGLALKIARVGLTDQVFVVAPTLTALPGEHRRLATVSGAVVGDGIVHLTIRDDVGVGYGVRGFGLFLDDGTLFAVYGQADRIVEKSALVALFLALDIAFPLTGIDKLTFGDTTFLLPPATTITKGLVELATEAEADAGTAGPLTITAALLARAVVAVKNYTDASLVLAKTYSDAGVAAAKVYADAAVAQFVREVNNALASINQAFAALQGRKITGAGLITGGGDGTADRTLTVAIATGAEVRAGVRNDTAVTPLGLAGAGAVYATSQKLLQNGGYRVWSDGLKECWGFVAVAANTTVTVAMPIAHTTFIAPAGAAGAIAQDEQMLGILNITINSFDVRSRNPVAAVYYWHSKGV